MSRSDKGWKYNAAVVASAISTVSWLVALVTGVYLTYLAITDEPSSTLATVLIVSFAAGVGFALLEKRLYRVDR